MAYKYQFQQMFFHWGVNGGPGSEHTFNHHSFPAELQLYGFNSQLYSNLSEAQEFPGGVVGVAVMVQVKGESPGGDQAHRHSGLGLAIFKLKHVKYRGDTARTHQLTLATIMPNTADNITGQHHLPRVLGDHHLGCDEQASVHQPAGAGHVLPAKARGQDHGESTARK